MILLTQNKNLIIFDKAEIYKTFGDEKNVKIEMVTQNDNYISLGEYDTAERADEILEEIIEQYEHEKDCKCDRGYLQTLDNFTYRMPKE